jgi:hypothetical protein
LVTVTDATERPVLTVTVALGVPVRENVMVGVLV